MSVRFEAQEFPMGMTIRELKQLVADLPEKDEGGEEYEVWATTGWCLSSPVINVWPLNRGDIIFGVKVDE